MEKVNEIKGLQGFLPHSRNSRLNLNAPLKLVIYGLWVYGYMYAMGDS